MKSPLAIAKKPSTSSKRGNQKKKFKSRIEKLRKGIKKINEEQKGITERQRQVREKFQIVELECEQLRKETRIILQQSASTQIRLAIIFQILKARENNDIIKASQLTHVLRQLISEQNNHKEALAATC